MTDKVVSFRASDEAAEILNRESRGGQSALINKAIIAYAQFIKEAETTNGRLADHEKRISALEVKLSFIKVK